MGSMNITTLKIYTGNIDMGGRGQFSPGGNPSFANSSASLSAGPEIQ